MSTRHSSRVAAAGPLRTLALLLPCVGLGFLLLHPGGAAADGGRVDRVSYVALGDSIAEGVAAEHTYGYVYRFRDGLASIRGEVDLVNAAHGGYATPDLLEQISSDEDVRSALRSADLITLSIGGNHMLACGIDNFATVDQECVAAGIGLFTRDWANVLEQLRGGDIHATGALMVMTLFNPYTGDDPSFAAVERPLQQINNLIRDASFRSRYDYSVVEIHDDFTGRALDGTWKVCDWLGFCAAMRDPHPNDAGHAEIARLHLHEYLAKT